MRYIVTGGAGFIGSELVRQLSDQADVSILNIDLLTYAGNQSSTRNLGKSAEYSFVREDIRDCEKMSELINDFKPNRILHLAAESHVDSSISGPLKFIDTNIVGTYSLLKASCEYLAKNPDVDFLFQHISTDEVYGSLGKEGYFNEQSRYLPNSPYSASKASSDHMVRSWNKTYGLPVIITNCSNNYGPYQHPEKLIPKVIIHCLKGREIPVYGSGLNVRDWLHVEDHVKALIRISSKATKDKIGETYCIGGNSEFSNLEVVNMICDLLSEMKQSVHIEYRSLIRYVKDRLGHDFRYAISSDKIRNDFGWQSMVDFRDGLRQTIAWYIDNDWWWSDLL